MDVRLLQNQCIIKVKSTGLVEKWLKCHFSITIPSAKRHALSHWDLPELPEMTRFDAKMTTFSIKSGHFSSKRPLLAIPVQKCTFPRGLR